MAQPDDPSTADLTAGDRVIVRYESVYSTTREATHVVEGTVHSTGACGVTFDTDAGERYKLILDVHHLDDELKKENSHATFRRIGYPEDVQLVEEVASNDEALDLDAGDVLAVTYDGPQGTRTATAEVVGVTDSIIDYTDVRALERAENRYVEFTFDDDGPSSVVRSMNSKSDRGHRLGWFERAVVAGHEDDPHAEKLAVVNSVEAGDRVALHGEDETLTGSVVYEPRRSGFTVELDDGRRASLHATAVGVTVSGVDVPRREVDVERLGTDERHETAARDAAAEWVRAPHVGDTLSLGGIEFTVCRDTNRHTGCTESVEIVETADYDPDELCQRSVTLLADALGLYATDSPGESERLPTAEILAENGVEFERDEETDDDGRDVLAELDRV